MSDSDPEEFYECPEGNVSHENLTVKRISVGSSSSSRTHSANQSSSLMKSSSNGSELRRTQPKLNVEAAEHHPVSVWGGRTSLPSAMMSRNDFSVWSILKHCIGMELSKITMPVVFNEPLSFLQRIVEYMEYQTLLRRAADSNDPIERHELVTAFAVSAAASNWDRIGKPFNPLLGETYELDREDLGFRIVCEQVSHHPPVSAFHVDSPHYTFHGSIHPKLKFWGKSVEITPKGLVTLYLKRHDEAYSWQNVNCCVHNVIVGKLWIEHYGSMEITNHKTKFRSVLNFLPCGWFGKDLHKIEGYLYNEKKQKVKAFYGKWIDALYSFEVNVWDEHLRTSSSGGGGGIPRSTSGSVKNQSTRREQCPSNAGGTDGGDIHTTYGTKACISKTYSESAMSEFAVRSVKDVPDDVPVRGSNCDLNLPSQRLLWVAQQKPLNSNLYYSFTSFALLLNEMNETLRRRLPPTDSRLRPDMRLMEEGLIDAAAEEKNKIEEKQRAFRKDKKKRKDDTGVLWFKYGLNPYTGKDDWLFTGEYWRRDWTKCPDIF